MKYIGLALCSALLLSFSCKPEAAEPLAQEKEPQEEEKQPEKEGFKLPEPDADAVFYSALHDPVADVGQYYHPENKLKPKAYWWLSYDYSTRNDPNLTDINKGLQNFLLMQSITGIVNRACEEGKTDVAVWTATFGKAYEMELADFVPRIDRKNAIDLLTGTFDTWNGIDVNIKQFFDGYVLTDVVNNPESANVAAVASHVFNALIVDVRDEAFFKEAGYVKKYDCTKKTISDAFHEFKDKCRNDCLVLMPVKSGEWRDYVIKNRLFIFNINKQYNDSSKGQNAELFEEVLDWLKPGSQIFGWEDGVGEDVFVGNISRHGHMLLCSAWSFNHALMSRNYKERQSGIVVKSINPRSIDYGKKKNFCSFFLSDGDSYYHLLSDEFEDRYYSLPSASATKTAFGLCTGPLSQLAPSRLYYLLQKQPSEQCTVMETFSCGYFFIDTFCTAPSVRDRRAECLKMVAERTAAHMRQHGIKILHLMAYDLSSEATKEALQAFVDANDQLEGIVTIQFAPYTGGKGNVYWLTNKAGYDIPCVSAKYMIWDGYDTPSSLASKMDAKEPAAQTFSAICLHCWTSYDGRRSSDLAGQCISNLPSRFEAVSMQELIWRLRMAERKEQTLKYLSTIK